MKLIRYTDHIDWVNLSETKKELYDLATIDVTEQKLIKAAQEVAAFQEENGEFAFSRDPNMSGDAYVDMVNYATCLCTAVLIRTVTRFPETMETYRPNLRAALAACAQNGFCGHGYDDQAHEETVIDLFQKSGCSKLMLMEATLCPQFSALWHNLDGTLLFVYGTLLRGQQNHHYMDSCTYLCNGEIYDYVTMDFDHMPGIKPQDGGRVVGEVYRVPTAVLPWLDQLEGEGYLYKRTPVTIHELHSFSCFPGVVYVPILNYVP